MAIDNDSSGDSSFANVRSIRARFEMLLGDFSLASAVGIGIVLEGVVAVEGEEISLAAGEALELTL